MRLTLDWDKISKEEFKRRLKILKEFFPTNHIQVFISPSGKGFHVIVYQASSSWEEIIKFREKFWDDKKRIGFDCFKKSLTPLAPTQILFDKKGGFSKKIYERSLMDKLFFFLKNFLHFRYASCS